MDKRTSPRAIYDRCVRWIAAHGGTKSQPGLGLMVADVFDVDPMAVARHVARAKDGTAPPQFFMPTSVSGRRARIERKRAEADAILALEAAGVEKGQRWWADSHEDVYVLGIRPKDGAAWVRVESKTYNWQAAYRHDYFLKAFIRVLPVEVKEVVLP